MSLSHGSYRERPSNLANNQDGEEGDENKDGKEKKKDGKEKILGGSEEQVS